MESLLIGLPLCFSIGQGIDQMGEVSKKYD
jgi:hypothetical protein